MAAAEERKVESEVVYKTKVVHFLGRSTPIVLQNDNGPCPLLAICNVLLLRNNLNLGSEASEVSFQKLLSLVAERLIDSNSNVQDKDDEYVNNQQQNIADAIDLLPRLATGIDVNVLFRKINDFEFTRECAVFDLLDIGLYHGWIVDPQDSETAEAIGSKSYNTLVAELVAFEANKSEGEKKHSMPEEDFVDFAAATTATLGVPSPSLSRGTSVDDSPVPALLDQRERRGDKEEAEELMRVWNISRTEGCNSVDMAMSPNTDLGSPNSEGSSHFEDSGSETHEVPFVGPNKGDSEKSQPAELFSSQECTSVSCVVDGLVSNVLVTESYASSPITSTGDNIYQLASVRSEDKSTFNNPIEDASTDSIQKEDPAMQCTRRDGSDECYANKSQISIENPHTLQSSAMDNSLLKAHPNHTSNMIHCNLELSSGPSASCANSNVSNGREDLGEVSESVSSSLESSEPIYEGEERILDSQLPAYEDKEPVYEGEVVLAEQADNVSSSIHCIDESARKQWQLIKTFLEKNASQLTIYGLFCLQEGLKERELCVFFRNNHFSTIFKFNGELYLLATDQGYINQPDLVWEKLNEVNGDTIFMTGNFKEFKAENQISESWNEQNLMSSTADYLASLGDPDATNSTFNSDLQLAIALQQQEFEQQPQRQRQQNSQPAASGRSRLVTGPQVPRASTSLQKSESKTKDKCIVM